MHMMSKAKQDINVEDRVNRVYVLTLVTKGASKFKMGPITIWLAMSYYDLCSSRDNGQEITDFPW
jgi:hypothetical protein